MTKHDIPTKEIGEILDTVSDKLPRLINELTKSFYSEESGAQIGRAVGRMYRELVDAGIPNEDALEMAKDYLNTSKAMMSQNFNMNSSKE